MTRDLVVEIEAVCRCRVAVLVEAAPLGEEGAELARAAAIQFVERNPAALKAGRPLALRSRWPLRAVSWGVATAKQAAALANRVPATAAERRAGAG